MSSLIKAKAKYVHDLCVAFLDKQEAAVLKLQEPCIQKAMKPKWFGLVKGKTRQEATQHLEDQYDLFGKYHLAKLSGCIETTTADKLRKLCLMNIEGEVLVDDFAASFLYIDGQQVNKREAIGNNMYA